MEFGVFLLIVCYLACVFLDAWLVGKVSKVLEKEFDEQDYGILHVAEVIFVALGPLSMLCTLIYGVFYRAKNSNETGVGKTLTK